MSLLVHYNYDDRKTLPPDAPSNRGYTAMDAHFPVAGTLQQFILIHSPSADLRSPKSLADLEQMAQRVSQLPGISLVRGITRPTGEMLEQARTTYQAGQVGDKLLDASTQISAGDTDLSRLSGGAHELADVLGGVKGQVVNAMGSVRGLVTALGDMEKQYGGDKTLKDIDVTATLVANMQSLGAELDKNMASIRGVYSWAAPIVTALNASPMCNFDPECIKSRDDLNRVVTAYQDGSLGKLSDLGRQLKVTQDGQTLDQTLRAVGKSLDQAVDSARKLGIADAASIQQKLNSVQQGASQLADASQQLAEGVQLLVDKTREMGGGLDQASAFLLAMKRDAAEPSDVGVLHPGRDPDPGRVQEGRSAFHLRRRSHRPVRGTDRPRSVRHGRDGPGQADHQHRQSARPNTTLADATISMVGFSAVQNDIRNYYNSDVELIIVITLIVVFLILVALLRAIVAPIYLVASVILSYVSAVGIGVLFFQFILGQQLSWNVPGMAFLVLVAVGADYNLLLISRIRDESQRGIRSGVIKTVGATGGVITSAGLIFSASMFGLTFSSISNIVQVGFIIGVGLLLDTFVVRTITVPAMAVLVGKANWWPSKAPAANKAEKEPAPAAASDDDETKELVAAGTTLRADTDFTDVT